MSGLRTIVIGGAFGLLAALFLGSVHDPVQSAKSAFRGALAEVKQ